jgi:hypothetical protein
MTPFITGFMDNKTEAWSPNLHAANDGAMLSDEQEGLDLRISPCQVSVGVCCVKRQGAVRSGLRGPVAG